MNQNTIVNKRRLGEVVNAFIKTNQVKAEHFTEMGEALAQCFRDETGMEWTITFNVKFQPMKVEDCTIPTTPKWETKS